MTVQDIDRGWSAIKRDLLRADDTTITVGIHSDAREHADGEGPPLTTATVGAFHEFGIGVPMRAWLGPSIDDHRDEILNMARDLYFGPLLSGKLTGKQVFGVIGERMQQVVQGRLIDKDPSWAPLAPATIARKAAKIRGGNRDSGGRFIPKRQAGKLRAEFVAAGGNPLIDTGLLRQSIRYKVTAGFAPLQGPGA